MEHSLLVLGQQCYPDIWSVGCPSKLYTQVLYSRDRSKASRIKDALGLSSKVFQSFNFILILERGGSPGDSVQKGE